MGRKPTKNLNLPPKMRVENRKKGKAYYLDTTKIVNGVSKRTWVLLGPDFTTALEMYSSVVGGEVKEQTNFTFAMVWQKYQISTLLTKSAKTQKCNIQESKRLLFTFGNVTLDKIKPMHIRRYLDHYRDKPRQADKEIALFSHVFNMARAWGLTESHNPATGVKKHNSHGRKVYIYDELLSRVYEHADEPLRDYLDFMYLSGQRNADALKANERQIIDGCYEFEQGKSKKKMRIEIIGEFATLINRIRTRRAAHKVVSTRLILDIDGTPMTINKLRYRFDRAREKADIEKDSFQMRDLRAKAATDKNDSHGLSEASDQLGHSSTALTKKVYVRRGKKVSPTR